MFFSSIEIDVKSTSLGKPSSSVWFVKHNGHQHHQTLMQNFYNGYCDAVIDKDSRSLMLDEANCARALLWDYLRRNFIAYDDHFLGFVSEAEIPKRQPDDEGEGFAIWAAGDMPRKKLGP